jgi:hypothetical protein
MINDYQVSISNHFIHRLFFFSKIRYIDLAVLAAFVNPVGSDPLSSQERVPVWECISNVDNFKGGCYHQDRLIQHVTQAVSLLDEEEYSTADGSSTFRKKFKSMIATHGGDPEFMKLINLLDSLYEDGLVQYEELYALVHDDKKVHLCSDDLQGRYAYVLASLPDRTYPMIIQSFDLDIIDSLERATRMLIEDYREEFDAQITEAFPNTGEVVNENVYSIIVGLEGASVPIIAALFNEAKRLGRVTELLTHVYPVSPQSKLEAALGSDDLKTAVHLLMSQPAQQNLREGFLNMIEKIQNSAKLDNLEHAYTGMVRYTRFLESLNIESVKFTEKLKVIQRSNIEAEGLLKIYRIVADRPNRSEKTQLHELVGEIDRMTSATLSPLRVELRSVVMALLLSPPPSSSSS